MMLGVSNRDNRNVDKTINNNNNNNKANFSVCIDVKEEANDEHTRSRERRNICTSLRNLGLNNSLNTESSISSSSCDSSSLFASPTPLINNSSSQSRVEEKRRKEKEERRNSLWFDNRTPPQQVNNDGHHHKASSQIKEYVYHRMTGIDYPMRMNYCWDFSSAHAQYVRRVAMAQRAFLSDRVRDFRSTFTRANFELEMDALKKRLDLGQPRPTFADLRRHHSVGY